MKTIKLCTFFLCLVSLSCVAQKEDLEKRIDEITKEWDNEAEKLGSYSGLHSLCLSSEYRNYIFEFLKEIHHYDTLLYEALVDASKTNKNRELKKTIEEIKKFENSYSMNSFISFMSEECKVMKDIEEDEDKTKNGVSENSFSGQIYLLETELVKYVNHITHRVDKIRLHAHHLGKYLHD